jgi:hypothetical protein
MVLNKPALGNCPYLRQVCHDSAGVVSESRFVFGAVMKVNRKLRRKKNPAWYKSQIKYIDAWIDQIRARRFGYRR